MAEIDRTSLQTLHQELTRRLDWMDRRRRMRPLIEAMMASSKFLMTRTVPEIMAGPAAMQYRSMQNLEKLMESAPEQVAKEQAEMDAALEAARRRTAALRKWLEDLS